MEAGQGAANTVTRPTVYAVTAIIPRPLGRNRHYRCRPLHLSSAGKGNVFVGSVKGNLAWRPAWQLCGNVVGGARFGVTSVRALGPIRIVGCNACDAAA